MVAHHYHSTDSELPAPNPLYFRYQQLRADSITFASLPSLGAA